MSNDPNIPPLDSTTAYPQPAPLAYARPGTRPLLPVLGRAKAVTICFWIMLVAYVLLGGLMLAAFFLLPDMEASGPPGNPALLIGLGLAMIGAGLAFVAVGITSVVLYCMWQYRVHSNAEAIENGPLAFTPGWGVGYWFIPILNLFRPYQVVKEINRATPPGDRPIDDLIGWWWACFIVQLVVSVIGSLLEGPNDSMTAGSIAMEMLSTVLNIVGILLALRIIRSISDRQAAVVGA